jgi:hypothetical protein
MKKNRFLMILMLLALSACLAALSGGQGVRAGVLQVSLGTVVTAFPNWTYDLMDETYDPGVQPPQGTELGCAASAAGDVNGDGVADAVVGADKFFNSVGERSGAAMLFFGSPSKGLSNHPDWMTTGAKGSLFGSAVSGAGNVNGDAYDDILVGAYNHKPAELMPEAGAVYVYYGRGEGPGSEADWQYNGDQREANLGWSVSAAGDVNGDTFADILVGAPLYEAISTTHLSEGAVFVFYGSANGLPDQPNWQANGGRTGAQLGRSVSGAGDVNGDGVSDIIAGAPGYASVGRAVVYYGQDGGDEGVDGGLEQTPAWQTLGPQTDSWFGYAVAGAGDVNGDGYDDVIVSAPQISMTVGTESAKAAVYVYLGSEDGLSAEPVNTLYHFQLYSRFGYQVAGAGDVNQDGYDDILVGARQYDDDQPDEGAVFLYYGSPLGVSSQPDWQAFANKADAYLGWGLGGAGDVNQDGYADIIAGAPAYKLNDKDPLGRAMVYFGSQGGMTGGIRLFLPLVVRKP